MTNKPNIAIVDYGVGNLWSLRKALSQFADAVVTEERDKIERADAIVLPGVGTFGAGMEGLRLRGLTDFVKERAAAVPLLGICLGAQILLERGHEFGEHQGLGLIKGEVIKFPELPTGVTIPAIGWQEVKPHSGQPLFEGIGKPYFYFVHSYVLMPPQADVIATTVYGGYEYCAAMQQGRIIGVQFHPEKSGTAGLQLLENFVCSI